MDACQGKKITRAGATRHEDRKKHGDREGRHYYAFCLFSYIVVATLAVAMPRKAAMLFALIEIYYNSSSIAVSLRLRTRRQKCNRDVADSK